MSYAAGKVAANLASHWPCVTDLFTGPTDSILLIISILPCSRQVNNIKNGPTPAQSTNESPLLPTIHVTATPSHADAPAPLSRHVVPVDVITAYRRYWRRRLRQRRDINAAAAAVTSPHPSVPPSLPTSNRFSPSSASSFIYLTTVYLNKLAGFARSITTSHRSFVQG